MKFVLVCGLVMFVLGCVAYIASFVIEKVYKKKMEQVSKSK